MGMYDTFGDGLQLKCFECVLRDYEIGDEVPVAHFGFPQDCTFAEWGGNPDSPYKGENLLGNQVPMGRFVIIKNGKLFKTSTDLKDIIKPVYDKYGAKLEERK